MYPAGSDLPKQGDLPTAAAAAASWSDDESEIPKELVLIKICQKFSRQKELSDIDLSVGFCAWDTRLGKTAKNVIEVSTFNREIICFEPQDGINGGF